MTRIPTITEREGLTDAQAAVFDALIESRGGVRGPFGVLLHRPEIAGPVQSIGGYLRFGATLPADVREAVILTTGQLWRCAHEWDMHLPIARDAGVPDETINSIEARSFADIPGEIGVATRLAAALLGAGRVPDDVFEAARASWAPDELVELVSIVGYYTMLALVINAFEVPSGARPPEPGA